MKRILTLLIIASVHFYQAEKAPAQDRSVISYPASRRYEPLEKRWKWAEKKSNGLKEGYWVGYSIEQLMSANSYIGRNSAGDRYRKPSLKMII